VKIWWAVQVGLKVVRVLSGIAVPGGRAEFSVAFKGQTYDVQVQHRLQ
jgi:hypothetical protein